MKKTFSVIMALVLFAGIVMGCSSRSSDDSSPSASAGSSPSSSPSAGGNGSGEEITLTYWMHQNDAFVNANKKLIADFEQAHSNIKIKVEIFPWDDYVQKIQTAYAGNEAPDIAQVFGSWVPSLAKAGFLAEIPNADTSKLYPAAVGAYSLEGKLYGIPREFNLENGGLLVNTKLAPDANPTTWQELLDTAKKLTEYEKDQPKTFGFDVYGDSVTFMFLSLVLQQGGKYWTDDQMVNFSTPEAVKAMQEIVDFKTKHKFADMSRTTYAYEDVFQGATAMTFIGPWVNALGKDYYKTTDYQYVAMPSYTGSSKAFAAESGWGEIVSEKSEHKAEALEFVNFITKTENNRYWNSNTATIPAEKAIAEDPEYVKQNEAIKLSLQVLSEGAWIGPIENRDFFFKQIYDNYEKAVKEGAPVDQVLKDAEKGINDMLAKERSK